MQRQKTTAGKRKQPSRASKAAPEIVPTKRTPRWSKLVLPAHVIAELRRLGGADA